LLEPQNREMALIRCPSCDTLHDIEGSFFANGARKVRCASCREVWEAVNPESTLSESAAPDAAMPALSAEDFLSPPAEAEPAAALDQAAIDAMDFGAPEIAADPAKPEPIAADEAAEISAEELEALFADPPAGEPEPTAKASEEKSGSQDKSGSQEKSGSEEIAFDPASLARTQDAAAKSEAEKTEEETRRLRREKRLAAQDAHLQPGKSGKGKPMAAMFMAAGLGTLAVVGLFRVEIARLFPATAPVFEAVGLGGQHALDISMVKGRLVQEGDRDMLEVSGTIANMAKGPQKIPVLRLSIRANNGQEIYVWTALADKTELAPGEKTSFARRLASPPQGSHSVLVRFVAKDDIVAAIR
jgi:predicted Zn finger-like uncharacterized protein